MSGRAHRPNCLHIMMRFVYRICKCKTKWHSVCSAFRNKSHHSLQD